MKDDLLTVNWFSYTVPNVSLTFDLVFTNFRTSTRRELIIYDTQRYQFTVNDVQACDMLEVLVTAGNQAGVSNPAAISGSLPVLPVLISLQYLLSKSNSSGVTLTVTFMVGCCSYSQLYD